MKEYALFQRSFSTPLIAPLLSMAGNIYLMKKAGGMENRQKSCMYWYTPAQAPDSWFNLTLSSGWKDALPPFSSPCIRLWLYDSTIPEEAPNQARWRREEPR